MSWITSTLWRLTATVAAKPNVALWIIKRAQRTPYFHIMSADGKTRYMGRWWLLNPYGRLADGTQGPARHKWLPSIRVHHIMRPDIDRHLHDHPWNARTIILRGWYSEERPTNKCSTEDLMRYGSGTKVRHGTQLSLLDRSAGYTGRLLFGQYHRIARVSEDGVWTIFITWKKRGTWGFDVDGVKVPHREYLAKHGGNP